MKSFSERLIDMKGLFSSKLFRIELELIIIFHFDSFYFSSLPDLYGEMRDDDKYTSLLLDFI